MTSKANDWPRMARGPLGNTASFHCAGDVPAGWVLVEPLPGSVETPKPPSYSDPAYVEGVAKRGPGRPKKATT